MFIDIGWCVIAKSKEIGTWTDKVFMDSDCVDSKHKAEVWLKRQKGDPFLEGIKFVLKPITAIIG